MIDVEKMIRSKYPKLKNNKIINGAISKFSDAIVHQDEINSFIQENKHLGAFEFIDEVLEYFNFDFSLKDKEIENIPASGRVVIIANHPLGGLDALALIKLLGKVRKDIKVVANDFLSAFESIETLVININNFKSRQSKDAINKIYNSLENEMAVVIFPSGEVSRASTTGIKDKKWHKGFLKFAHRSNSPILPVFIGGKNSKTFYSVSAINKKLSALLLSNEMFKQKNKSINILIGEIIPSEHTTPKAIPQDKLIDLYKKHLYNLKNNKSFFVTQKAIAHPEDRRHIKKELKQSPLLGETKDGKMIYLYESVNQDSIVINEIGRLRELSFRKVGEGVNKKRDIDKYDRYYKHIVLWDNEDLEIVGAYRIGVSSEIVHELSVAALYTNSLFEYTQDFDKYLQNSIELGRSFVQPKYWGSRALDYLWQGIGAYIRNNPKIKYLYGPVSISQTYPKVAKDMIIYFYDTYFSAKNKVALPRLPYQIDYSDDYFKIFQKELHMDNYKEDFKTLKKALGFLNLSVPTMYKQYADLCEEGGIEFCAYNIDKDFSDCVDSFILVSVDKIKQKQKERYFL